MLANNDSHQFGINQQHMYSVGDETRCPHCYKNSLVKMGVLTTSGGIQNDVNKCTSCNRITSASDGGIRSLLNEAAFTIGTGGAGFVSTTNNSFIGQHGPEVFSNGISGQYGATPTIDSNTSSKFDSMNVSLSSLVIEMKNLTKTVSDLALQNKDLMEKLTTDPLNGIRKAVSSFNLE